MRSAPLSPATWWRGVFASAYTVRWLLIAAAIGMVVSDACTVLAPGVEINPLAAWLLAQAGGAWLVILRTLYFCVMNVGYLWLARRMGPRWVWAYAWVLVGVSGADALFDLAQAAISLHLFAP